MSSRKCRSGIWTLQERHYFSKSLMKRLFQKNTYEIQVQSESLNLDVASELEHCIQVATKIKHDVDNVDFTSMSEEMTSFDCSGILTPNLSLLYEVLKSIPATSVDF